MRTNMTSLEDQRDVISLCSINLLMFVRETVEWGSGSVRSHTCRRPRKLLGQNVWV